jgi:3-phosphoshikimate 1-carboxyvinyltransferase
MDLEIIEKKSFSGTVAIPPSKSYSQRALALSFLVDNIHISNFGNSDDEQAGLSVVQSCQSSMTSISDSELSISNTFDFESDITLDCKESGLSSRLYAIFFLLNRGKTTILGRGTLLERTFLPVLDIYKTLDISYVISPDHRLPLSFEGKKTDKRLFRISTAISSQFLTGLLYYLVGLHAKETIVLKVENLSSKPYIDMTMAMLRQIGSTICWDTRVQNILIYPSVLKKSVEIRVESDWSSASLWLVAGAIDGNIRLKGLAKNSLQADRKILDILEQFGARLSWNNEELNITSEKNNPFEIDLEQCPDLAIAVFILASYSRGISTIYGLHRLQYKESNRKSALLQWLDMLSITYTLSDNSIAIEGNPKMQISPDFCPVFETYKDHRLVMGGSIWATLLGRGIIKNREAASKSYPSFMEDLKLLTLPIS